MRFTVLTTLVLATMAYAAPEADGSGMTRIARSDILPRQFGCVSAHPFTRAHLNIPTVITFEDRDAECLPNRTAVKAAVAPLAPPAAPTAAAPA